MDELTASWWVVNVSIVVTIFVYFYHIEATLFIFLWRGVPVLSILLLFVFASYSRA